MSAVYGEQRYRPMRDKLRGDLKCFLKEFCQAQQDRLSGGRVLDQGEPGSIKQHWDERVSRLYGQ